MVTTIRLSEQGEVVNEADALELAARTIATVMKSRGYSPNLGRALTALSAEWKAIREGGEASTGG
jgi:hypothetical protein